MNTTIELPSATTNVKHLSRFTDAKTWQEIQLN